MIIVPSFPTTYLKSGVSEVTASRIAFATSDGCYIWLYGELALTVLVTVLVCEVGCLMQTLTITYS